MWQNHIGTYVPYKFTNKSHINFGSLISSMSLDQLPGRQSDNTTRGTSRVLTSVPPGLRNQHALADGLRLQGRGENNFAACP